MLHFRSDGDPVEGFSEPRSVSGTKPNLDGLLHDINHAGNGNVGLQGYHTTASADDSAGRKPGADIHRALQDECGGQDLGL